MCLSSVQTTAWKVVILRRELPNMWHPIFCHNIDNNSSLTNYGIEYAEEFNKWLQSTNVPIVGEDGKSYTSGYHLFVNQHEALTYLRDNDFRFNLKPEITLAVVNVEFNNHSVVAIGQQWSEGKTFTTIVAQRIMVANPKLDTKKVVTPPQGI